MIKVPENGQGGQGQVLREGNFVPIL